MNSSIYEPAEDSYLLQESLKEYLSDLIVKDKNKICYRSFSNQKPLNSPANITNINNTNDKLKNKSFSNQKPPYSPVNITDTKEIKSIKILDMGSGSGIQAKTCRELGFNNVLAADINPEAIKELKKQKINVIHSDLFSKIDNKEKFNLIIFNPPYLPEDNDEPVDSKTATTAGKHGYELIIKFLKQAKTHLEKDGVILLLFSSLSKPNIIKEQAKQMNYKMKLLKRQKLFFEELFVYELYQSSFQISLYF